MAASRLRGAGVLRDEVRGEAPHSHLPEAFRRRLIEVAGFKYVPEPVLMRMDDLQGPPLYYLFFASHNKTGARIAEHVFKDSRPPQEPQLF